MSDSMQYFRIFVMMLLPIFTIALIFIIDPAIIPELGYAIGDCNTKNITVSDKYIDDLYFIIDSNGTVYILCSPFTGSYRKIPVRYKNYEINSTYQVTICTFDTIMEEKENE